MTRVLVADASTYGHTASAWPWPTITTSPALECREYDFMTRLGMRLMMAYGHHPTDIRHDVEYTEADVDDFARTCATLASGAPA